MKLVDLLTIAGLVLGPTFAVLISLLVEHRRQAFVRKSNAIRTLLIGRTNFADPSFQVAINTIPIEFPRDDRVLAAWESYLAAVATQTPKGDESAARAIQERWNSSLSILLQAMLISTGYKEREAAEIARSAYVSTASAEQRRLQLDALSAVVEIASNTRRVAEAGEAMRDRPKE